MIVAVVPLAVSLQHPPGLRQVVDSASTGNAGMSRERQTQSKLRDLVIFQPIRDRERDFLRALLVVFDVACIERCYVGGVVVGVDGDEGAEQHTKLRRGQDGWRIPDNPGDGLRTTLLRRLLSTKKRR